MRKHWFAVLLIAFILPTDTSFADPPDNDSFASPRIIPTATYTDGGNSDEATTEPGEPSSNCGYDLGKTVWYSYTSSASEPLSANTFGSTFDTILAVYTGSDLTDLTQITCNDDASGLQSKITFTASEGVTYYFQLGGYLQSSGNYIFRLVRPGRIEGTISIFPTNVPARICIEAYTASSYSWTAQTDVEVPVDGSASYSLPVDPGTYRVYFYGCPGYQMVPEWYNDKDSFYTADDVFVGTNTATTSIDAVIEAYGGISGFVSVPGTSSVHSICIIAHRSGTGLIAGTSATAPVGGSAEYSLGLEAGEYVVEFRGCSSGTLATEWYDDKSDAWMADSVTVTAGWITGGINAELTELGGISGTVSVPGSDTQEVVCIAAYPAGSDYFVANTLVWIDPGQTVTYSLPLEPRDYNILFYDCQDGHVKQEWYDNKQDRASAEIVTVSGTYVGGIDAELSLRGSITGTVSIPGASAGHYVCISAYTSDYLYSDSLSAWVPPGETFDYEFYLYAGDFKIQFADCYGGNLQTEWYDDKPDFESGDLVRVIDAQTTGGIDAELSSVGYVEGVVSVAGSSSTHYICIDVYRSSNQSLVETTSIWAGSNGTTYQTPVAAGDYKVLFYDCGDGTVRSQWYNMKEGFSSADIVYVSAGQITSGINALLSLVDTPIPPPTYDLAITDLRVENLAIVTDYGPVAYTGMQRRVHLSAANLGDYSSSGVVAWLSLKVCPKTFGGCSQLHAERLNLGPGQSLERSFDWNGSGAFGDMKVIANICGYTDRNPENNRRELNHYVIAGNTGLGATTYLPPYGYDPCA